MTALNDSSRSVPRLALNQAEAAAALGVGPNTFKQHVRPHLKRVGGSTRYPVAEVERWLDKNAYGL
jgi:hypothetical protein